MKLIIDQNALNGFADALSGRSRNQGKLDALKIQSAQDQMMANRDKMLEPVRQREAQRNYAVNSIAGILQDPSKAALAVDYFVDGKRSNDGFKMRPDGSFDADEFGAPILESTPIDLGLDANTQAQVLQALAPMQAIKAFGGDAVDYTKAQGGLNKNSFESALRGIAQQGVEQGNAAQAGLAATTLEGRAFDPYKTDGFGQRVNTVTGDIGQTQASQAKIGEINSSTNYNNAGVGLRQAQTQKVGHDMAINEAELALKQQEYIDKQNGIKSMDASKTKLLFSKQVDDGTGTGKQITVFDGEAYGQFRQFMLQNNLSNEEQAFAAWTNQVQKSTPTQAQIDGNQMGNIIGKEIENVLASEAPVSQYDKVNQGNWSATGAADTVLQIDKIAQTSMGKPLSKMNQQEVENALISLYHAGKINRLDVENLHKIYVSKEPLQY